MSAELPVPVSFRLPDPAWEPVDPASLGVTNAAFLAVRREHVGTGYAPTLTLSGDLVADGTPLEGLADDAVDVLAAQADGAELVKRREYGSEDAPGLLQQLDCRIRTDDGALDVRQLQALLDMRDTSDGAEPPRRFVLKVVLSTTFAQHETYLPEFQEFLRTLRVSEPAA